MIICKCLADYVGLCVLDFLFYFFVNDVILLASSSADLQLTLGQFVAEWEAAEKISTSKSEVTVLSLKGLGSPLWVRSKLLPQSEAV